jgi:hypothetical protein
VSDDYGARPDPDTAYPVVRLLVKHGTLLAIAAGAVLAIAGIWAALAGFGWAWAPAGVLTGAFAGFIMRSYVEVVRLIADMLLPR